MSKTPCSYQVKEIIVNNNPSTTFCTTCKAQPMTQFYYCPKHKNYHGCKKCGPKNQCYVEKKPCSYTTKEIIVNNNPSTTFCTSCKAQPMTQFYYCSRHNNYHGCKKCGPKSQCYYEV